MEMKPCVVMQTDFGVGGGGAMFGVCKQVDLSLDVYEITHTIPQFNVQKASSSLRGVMPFWPQGTIFVSVVDPGVGTERKASIAKTSNGYYIVTPDNGSLTHLLHEFGIDEIREIDEQTNRYKGTEKTSIFHGRDLFAYCAARLAAGVITYEEVGPAYPVSDIVTFDIPCADVSQNQAHGYITDIMDTFGNLETNIRIEDFEKTGIVHGDVVRATITWNNQTKFDKCVLYHRAFGFTEVGEEIMYNSSTGFMGLAINQNNFAHHYSIGVGDAWRIDIVKEEEA